MCDVVYAAIRCAPYARTHAPHALHQYPTEALLNVHELRRHSSTLLSASTGAQVSARRDESAAAQSLLAECVVGTKVARVCVVLVMSVRARVCVW
jgi:hypothetical protein